MPSSGPILDEPDIAKKVWQTAVRYLANGKTLHQNSLVTLVKHETGLSEPVVVSHITRGFAGAVSDGVYYDLAPEHRLHLTMLGVLPSLLQTPAGNPRAVSVSLEASGANGHFRGRFEAVDEDRSYWFCMRIGQAEHWAALREEAETADNWGPPLQPATDHATMPAPLIWRFSEPAHAAAAARRAAKALGVKTTDKVELIELRYPLGPLRMISDDQRTIERLTRRRGTIPAGRKYPIQGYCDHCGQPLSDPYSLLVGVGPICRQYYSPRVLAAVANANGPTAPPLARRRTVDDALAVLAEAWV